MKNALLILALVLPVALWLFLRSRKQAAQADANRLKVVDLEGQPAAEFLPGVFLPMKPAEARAANDPANPSSRVFFNPRQYFQQ